MGLTRFAVGEAEGGERGRCGLCLPHGLNGSQLHLLVFGRQITRFIAQHHHGQRSRQTKGCCHGHRSLCQVQVPSLEQIPGRNPQHKQRSHHISSRHGVHELGLRNRIGQHGKEVGHLHAHGLRIEGGSYRVLHPAVCHQNPQRRKVGANRHQAGHHQVLDLAQAIPAKEEQAHKGGFQEKGHQTFNRQRRTKDVTHIVAVIAPVHAELKLHHHPGGDTHGEVDAKQHTPELGHVAPDRAPGHHKHRLHDGDENGQAQRQRHKQKVVERRYREL